MADRHELQMERMARRRPDSLSICEPAGADRPSHAEPVPYVPMSDRSVTLRWQRRERAQEALRRVTGGSATSGARRRARPVPAPAPVRRRTGVARTRHRRGHRAAG